MKKAQSLNYKKGQWAKGGKEKMIKKIIGRKRLIITALVLLSISIVGAGVIMTTNTNAPKNSISPEVVKMEFNYPPVAAEDYVAHQKTEPQKLEDKGTIFVSSEPTTTTIFLLREKERKFIQIRKDNSPIVFEVKIGHIYKVVAKKEGYLTWISSEIQMNTPEQIEKVFAQMDWDPNVPIDLGDEIKTF
jgi:hypothetical protein